MTIIEIVSIVFNVILAVFSVWQWIEQKKEKELIKSQIKVWHNVSNGFRNALVNIWHNVMSKRFTNVSDVMPSISTLIPIVEGFNNSLLEERFFSEKEIKENLQKALETNKKAAEDPSKSQNTTILQK
jgi:hypothetical protein